MDGNKSCITINCGCCSKDNSVQSPGVNERLDLIYDGMMNDKKVYNLLKPITDYECLIVEAGMHYVPSDHWSRKHELIYKPEVSDKYSEYSCIVHIQPNGSGRYIMNWHFPTATTLSMDFYEKVVGPWDDLAIRKIYGIK